MPMLRCTVLAVLAIPALAAAEGGWEPVAAIFAEHCVECHGPAKAKGGLRLDSPARVRAGGHDGPVLTPGDARASSLARVIALPADAEGRMPPKGPRLDAAQVAAVRAWIAAEAKP